MLDTQMEKVRHCLARDLSDNDDWHGLIDTDDPSAGYWVDITNITDLALEAFVKSCCKDERVAHVTA